MSFENAIVHVLKKEGGRSNRKDDKGGRTAFGITQATYTRWRKSKDLKPYTKDVWEITKDEYLAIYREIWVECRADLIDAYAPWSALVHFDMAVNAGFQRRGTDAAEILQMTCSSLDAPTDVDGYVGPHTMDAVKKAIDEHGDKEFAEMYLIYRAKYYTELAKADAVYGAPNLDGWLKRLDYYHDLIDKG